MATTVRNQPAVYDNCLVASARRVVAPYGEKCARPQPTTPFIKPSAGKRAAGGVGPYGYYCAPPHPSCLVSSPPPGKRALHEAPLRRILCPLPCQRYRLSSIPTAQGGTHRSRPTEKPHPLPFPMRSLRGHPFSFPSSLKKPPIHYYNNCTHFPFTAGGFFAIIFIMYHAIDCAPRGREEGRT